MERLWKKTQLRGQTGKGRGGSGKKNASSGVFFSFFFLPRVLSRAAPPNVGNWMAYGVAAYRRKKSSELINETLELWHLLIQWGSGLSETCWWRRTNLFGSSVCVEKLRIKHCEIREIVVLCVFFFLFFYCNCLIFVSMMQDDTEIYVWRSYSRVSLLLYSFEIAFFKKLKIKSIFCKLS